MSTSHGVAVKIHSSLEKSSSTRGTLVSALEAALRNSRCESAICFCQDLLPRRRIMARLSAAMPSGRPSRKVARRSSLRRWPGIKPKLVRNCLFNIKEFTQRLYLFGSNLCPLAPWHPGSPSYYHFPLDV